MVVLDVTAQSSVPLRFVAGVLGGVLATLAMDLVMPRLPEGSTAPSVASGVLTRRPPPAAPDRLATVVHYLAGMLTGPLFVWLLFAGEVLLGGPSLASTAAAAVVLYVLMVGFFVVVVLPQSQLPRDRVGPAGRDWALCALVYVAVLVPVLAAASRTL